MSIRSISFSENIPCRIAAVVLNETVESKQGWPTAKFIVAFIFLKNISPSLIRKSQSAEESGKEKCLNQRWILRWILEEENILCLRFCEHKYVIDFPILSPSWSSPRCYSYKRTQHECNEIFLPSALLPSQVLNSQKRISSHISEKRGSWQTLSKETHK